LHDVIVIDGYWCKYFDCDGFVLISVNFHQLRDENVARIFVDVD
jgi:hypothetical protein